VQQGEAQASNRREKGQAQKQFKNLNKIFSKKYTLSFKKKKKYTLIFLIKVKTKLGSFYFSFLYFLSKNLNY
jgi:hypothetical protein